MKILETFKISVSKDEQKRQREKYLAFKRGDAPDISKQKTMLQWYFAYFLFLKIKMNIKIKSNNFWIRSYGNGYLFLVFPFAVHHYPIVYFFGWAHFYTDSYNYVRLDKCICISCPSCPFNHSYIVLSQNFDSFFFILLFYYWIIWSECLDLCMKAVANQMGYLI